MPTTAVTMRELLEAGVHFGHQTRRWNPKMRRFIFGERGGIYIIDLQQSIVMLQDAYDYVRNIAERNGTVLFVGTKKQAQQAIKETAKEAGQFYVTERWLGGTLTNFQTIKRSIARMKQIEKMESDGSINNYVKQEQSMIRREAARQVKYFDGIRAMDKYPGAMFVVDIKREHNAVAEARKLKIPVVAIVDTNCDPDLVNYPVAGNDDAIRSVRMILATVGAVITQARGEYEAKFGRRREEPTEKFDSAQAVEAAAGDDPSTPESSPE